MILYGGVSNNNGVISFLPAAGLPSPFGLESVPQILNSIVITVKKTGTCEVYQFTFRQPFPDIPVLANSTTLNVNHTGDEYSFFISPSENMNNTGDLSSDNSRWQLEIIRYDTGLSVYKSQTDNASLTVNTAGWAPGIYIAVAIVNGQTVTKQLSIQ